jgi:hypothetical protein
VKHHHINKFPLFGSSIKDKDMSAISNTDIVALLRTGIIADSFIKKEENCCKNLRLKVYFRTGIRLALITKVSNVIKTGRFGFSQMPKGFKEIRFENESSKKKSEFIEGRCRHKDRDYYFLVKNMYKMIQQLGKTRQNDDHTRQAEDDLTLFLNLDTYV